jgi:hypothetical protein
VFTYNDGFTFIYLGFGFAKQNLTTNMLGFFVANSIHKRNLVLLGQNLNHPGAKTGRDATAMRPEPPSTGGYVRGK